MSPDEIYQRLTQLLRDVFDDNTLVAQPELSADHVSAWDSFAHLRLIFAVEKSFGVSFAAAQVAALKNVGDLAALIHSKAT